MYRIHGNFCGMKFLLYTKQIGFLQLYFHGSLITSFHSFCVSFYVFCIFASPSIESSVLQGFYQFASPAQVRRIDKILAVPPHHLLPTASPPPDINRSGLN